MNGCESWTIKKAERRRIDAFELWCWRSPWCSLERLVLKLKLQYFATWCEELTHLKRPWCWERLRAGGEGDVRGWDVWMAPLTQWTWVWVDSESWWWAGRPGVLWFTGSQKAGHDWATSFLPSFLSLILFGLNTREPAFGFTDFFLFVFLFSNLPKIENFPCCCSKISNYNNFKIGV